MRGKVNQLLPSPCCLQHFCCPTMVRVIILTNCHYPRAASLARNTTRRVNYGWSNQQQSDMNQFGGIEWASYHPCGTVNQGATTNHSLNARSARHGPTTAKLASPTHYIETSQWNQKGSDKCIIIPMNQHP